MTSQYSDLANEIILTFKDKPVSLFDLAVTIAQGLPVYRKALNGTDTPYTLEINDRGDYLDVAPDISYSLVDDTDRAAGLISSAAIPLLTKQGGGYETQSGTFMFEPALGLEICEQLQVE